MKLLVLPTTLSYPETIEHIIIHLIDLHEFQFQHLSFELNNTHIQNEIILWSLRLTRNNFSVKYIFYKLL